MIDLTAEPANALTYRIVVMENDAAIPPDINSYNSARIAMYKEACGWSYKFTGAQWNYMCKTLGIEV